jgi:O-antigen ligase
MILNSLILILISTGFLSTKSIFKERMIDTTINQIKFSDEHKFNIISSAHHPIIMNGVNIFIDNPIFGIGTKLFREECKLYDAKGCNIHPHNSYVQLLAETGLIGFFFLLIYFIYISKKIFFFVRQKNLLSYNNLGYYTLLVLIFANFFIYQPNMSLFHNWINVLYFSSISIVLSLNGFREYKI